MNKNFGLHVKKKVLCVTLFCGILILLYLANTKLKHPQTKNVAYGHDCIHVHVHRRSGNFHVLKIFGVISVFIVFTTVYRVLKFQGRNLPYLRYMTTHII